MRAVVAASLLAASCSAPAVPSEAASEPAPVAASVAGTPGVDAPQRGLEVLPLEVNSRGRVHRFRVEVARTAEQQRIGMMFRTGVDPNRGMIFPYARPAVLGFWMRNTLIPLDLIFIRQDGSIARIVTGQPRDDTSLRSGEPVIAVLEIAGGRAAELGIRPGDRISTPALPAPAPRG